MVRNQVAQPKRLM